MEPGKLAISGHPLPVRARASRLSTAALLLALACGRGSDAPPPATGDTGTGSAGRTPPAPAGGTPGQPAPPPTEPRLDHIGEGGFRPVAFTDTAALWGILRGRLALLDPHTGRAAARPHAAWSVAAAPDVVSWRNETGTWGERTGDSPRRLAPTQLMPGYDGPPDVLWSPSGRRAVLTWTGEWDGHHELLDEYGSRATLATLEEGYMLDFPALWLDEHRILFTIVASAPRAGEPAYRESGWRGDLAVLDLAANDSAGEFRRVTDTPDTTWLRPAGLLDGDVLVTEYDPRGVRAHWRYHPDDWSRTAIDLPPGRAFAAGDVVVTYEPLDAPDAWAATLHAGGRTTALGQVADPDLPPAMTRDGRRIALRVLQQGRPTVLLVRR